MAVGRTVWGPKVPTLKGTEASLFCVQCFLYLVSFSMSLFFILHGWISSRQTLYIQLDLPVLPYFDSELTKEDSLPYEHSKCPSFFWVFVQTIAHTRNLFSPTFPCLNQFFNIWLRSHIHQKATFIKRPPETLLTYIEFSFLYGVLTILHNAENNAT